MRKYICSWKMIRLLRTLQLLKNQFTSIDLFVYRKLHKFHIQGCWKMWLQHKWTLQWRTDYDQHEGKASMPSHLRLQISRCIDSIFSNINSYVYCILQSNKFLHLELQLNENKEELQFPFRQTFFQKLNCALWRYRQTSNSIRMNEHEMEHLVRNCFSHCNQLVNYFQ